MKLTRSIDESIRSARTWDELWNGPDQGLIACWERGRAKRHENPNLARKAEAGQLVVLPWKGGVEKATKVGKKYGALYYLAMWQGLRSEDLSIDTTEECAVVCTATGMTVVFTVDPSRYAEA